MTFFLRVFFVLMGFLEGMKWVDLESYELPHLRDSLLRILRQPFQHIHLSLDLFSPYLSL